MQQLLRQCMEKSAMAQVVAEYGGVITVHVRGEGDLLIEATDKLLRMTRATGALAGKLLFRDAP